MKEPLGETKTIPCTTLLCCNERRCDFDIFSAINDSGLVFDGGIVVDQVYFHSTVIYALTIAAELSHSGSVHLCHGRVDKVF